MTDPKTILIREPKYTVKVRITSELHDFPTELRLFRPGYIYDDETRVREMFSGNGSMVCGQTPFANLDEEFTLEEAAAIMQEWPNKDDNLKFVVGISHLEPGDTYKYLRANSISPYYVGVIHLTNWSDRLPVHAYDASLL